VTGGATFSRDRRFRYRLWRRWDGSLPVVAFVMLNPSTADASQDDPTIRRCIGFARSWGFGGVEIVNLFAYRATDPRELRRMRHPVGPRNDRAIAAATSRAAVTVVAWGAGRPPERTARVARLLRGRDVRQLRLTKEGHPAHPLYLRKDVTPAHWRPI
jgi:hypothetical protein